MRLLVQESDVNAVGAILHGEWLEMLEREGLDPVQAVVSGDTDEPPCPACGTAAPLVDGACSDCGLQLA